MKNKVKIYSLFVVFLWANISNAQVTTTAKIQAVAKSGLYKMILPPDIRSFSREDLSDFRIFDSKNSEVPYFILRGMPEKMTEDFEDFRILSKVKNKKSTVIEIENTKTQINGLQLVIANSEVIKKYNISGSNDQKEWFGLVNDGELSDLKSAETTSVSKEISFPLSSYHFIKIVFDDSTTLPINVLKIGNTQTHFLKGTLQEIKAKSIETTQVSVEKKTVIKVVFDFPQYLDKVVLAIPNPNLFRRNARIYTEGEREEKHKTVKFQAEIARFSLVSNQNNSFEIAHTKQQVLFIEIDNQDNPPLQIANIQFFQKPIFAIADLKSNENYTITTGDPKISPPQYDLAYFKETISDALPETQITSIAHQKQAETAETEGDFWQKPWFMWLCISIGGLMILFFSLRLVKEI